MEDASIAISVRGCLELFQTLDSLPSPLPNTPHQTALMAIADEESRFKVWSGSIGAHASGRRSLQFRLRDASHLRKHVLAILNDLSKLLEKALAIMKEDMVPWDQYEDDDISDSEPDLLEDDSDNDELPKTEMEQIAYSVSNCVDCLLQLSIALRNPAPHDRFATSIPIDVSHFESFDIQHVQAKFPGVDGILAQRLGNAISRRRQYFKYRESHHLKLAHGIDPKDKADGKSTIASSIPGHVKSTGFDNTLHAINEDALSDAGVSQTSFASSLADTERLRIPLLPQNAESGPFECPFCFMIITATNRVSWKRHVFADLRPYICLSEDCAVAENWFARRHEWMLHEIENHWNSYVCPYSCGEAFQCRSKCIEHVYKNHPSNIPIHQVEAMISLSSRPIQTEEGLSCPICQDRLESVKNYQTHVGRHQEQLAIFALPNTHSQDDDDPDYDDEGLDDNEYDLDDDENDEKDLGDDESFGSSLGVSARVSLGSSAAEGGLHNEGMESTDRTVRYNKDNTKGTVQSEKSTSKLGLSLVQEHNSKLSSKPGPPEEQDSNSTMSTAPKTAKLISHEIVAQYSSRTTVIEDTNYEHQHVDDGEMYHKNPSQSQQQKEFELKRHKEAEAAADEKPKRDKEYRVEAELRRALLAFEAIEKREAEAELEERIKKEVELERLEEEAAEERRWRDALAHDDVERYNKAETDRIAHGQNMKEQNDEEYKRRLHDDLVKSGLDEHDIEAMLSLKKVRKTVTTMEEMKSQIQQELGAKILKNAGDDFAVKSTLYKQVLSRATELCELRLERLEAEMKARRDELSVTHVDDMELKASLEAAKEQGTGNEKEQH